VLNTVLRKKNKKIPLVTLATSCLCLASIYTYPDYQQLYLGWLDDDCVASGEAGGHLPGEHHQGIVPGGDQTTHPCSTFSFEGWNVQR
jgi:hypothetical protein